MIAVLPADAPPVVLRLVGHPLRWRLLRELARSDARVRELRAIVGEPQSLVSYHLGRLRDAQLVRARRSSFDARQTYYRADLARCGELLADAGGALHPGLQLVAPPVPPVPPRPRRAASPTSVLFLCTGNSARSQMAEALFARRAGDGAVAQSAGSSPKPVHPNASRVMRSYGVDMAGARSKHFDELAERRFDYVVSLCDRVREVCPELADPRRTIHWSIPDPAQDGDTDATTYPAFERTAAELETRIRLLLLLIDRDQQTRR